MWALLPVGRLEVARSWWSEGRGAVGQARAARQFLCFNGLHCHLSAYKLYSTYKTLKSNKLERMPSPQGMQSPCIGPCVRRGLIWSFRWGPVSPWRGSHRKCFSLRPGPVFPASPSSPSSSLPQFLSLSYLLRMGNGWQLPSSLMMAIGFCPFTFSLCSL